MTLWASCSGHIVPTWLLAGGCQVGVDLVAEVDCRHRLGDLDSNQVNPKLSRHVGALLEIHRRQ